MGYQVRPLPDKKSEPKWKLQYVSCKKADRKPESKAKSNKTTWNVSKDRWRSLGFHKFMPIEDAKARAKQLNSQLEIKRQEEHLRNLEMKQREVCLKYNSFLPEEFVQEFERLFVKKRNLKENTRKRKTQRQVTWTSAQKMIVTIGIEPSEWYYNIDAIYDYFYDEALSINYVKAIIRMSNLWGYFICRKLGRPFLSIPHPKGHEKQRLVDNYHENGKHMKKPAKGLPPKELYKAKKNLSIEHFNWLYISLWLGLRPKEIDSLHNKKMWRLEKINSNQQVISVFQTKIITVPPEDRWKPIPIQFDEQKIALKIIESGNFKRPYLRTVRKYITGERITLYSGRKGFVDLMLSKKQSLENISIWMGHGTIHRTWRSYKDKLQFHI